MKKASADNNKKRHKALKLSAIALAILLILFVCGFIIMFFYGLSGLYADKAPDEKQIKVACVGDSVTYGHGIKNWPKNNYPAVLNNILGDGYCVGNFGVSGCTVQNDGDQPYMNTKRYRQSLEYNADILVLMMGSNDSKLENWKGAEEFKRQYNDLIDSYLNNGDTQAIILCTPPMPYYINGKTDGLMSFNISAEQVKEIADIVREIAQERNLQLIDIYGLTSQHCEWFEIDGVHPNADGAAAIAQEIYNNISY